MTRIPTMAAVMTPFPHAVDEATRLDEAKSIMEEHEFRHLPVMREGHLAGILTCRDITRAAAQREGGGDSLKVADVAEMEAYTVDLSAPLDQVAGYMAQHHIGSALVVKGNKLAGIFTSTDACRCLAEVLLGGTLGVGDPPDDTAA